MSVGERRTRQMTRRELLGYWPMAVLTVVVMAVVALTVAFNLGG